MTGLAFITFKFLNSFSMTSKLSTSILISFITVVSAAQVKPLLVQPNIILPKDTIVSNNLIKSLNGFLSLKENPNKDNSFVLAEDLLETSILLDEIKGIEKSGKFKDDNFYKGYLTNVVQLNESNYLIQFSYIGVNENSPILMASFKVIGKNKGNKFYFSSPLKYNTSSWKIKKTDNVVFHYKNVLNEKSIKKYVKDVSWFDKKLSATNQSIEWYGCNNMPELLQNIGVEYKMIYNSQNTSIFTAKENNTLLIVSGDNNSTFESYDPHDLWHERLHYIISPTVINKAVDEGCAYLYGSSWGISWEQILKAFKDKVSSDKSTDWLKTYEDFYNFGESKEKHLLVPYVLNALIVQKIEKEKGFNAVKEFLSCGKFQKGNENYFMALEKLTGITKSNFNDSIWKLIAESGK